MLWVTITNNNNNIINIKAAYVQEDINYTYEVTLERDTKRLSFLFCDRFIE